MTSYTKKIIEIESFPTQDLEATFYYSEHTEYKATIIYFHGGGFIFGHREDLPEKYIELLTSTGIGVVAVDYPLAPETKLTGILEQTKQVMDWFIQDFLADFEEKRYFIMGRSAGGFLALANGTYANQFSNQPQGIVSLYGYFNLNDASFSVPNRYYLKYPKVNDRIVTSLIKKEPVLVDAHQRRFPIYLAARQKGDWMDLVLDSSDQKSKLSLKQDQLKELPPLFVAAATKDPDVPTQQTRQLAKMHSDTNIQLYDSGEHDFDRTHEDTLGIELYEKITTWLLEKLS